MSLRKLNRPYTYSTTTIVKGLYQGVKDATEVDG